MTRVDEVEGVIMALLVLWCNKGLSGIGPATCPSVGEWGFLNFAIEIELFIIR